MKNHLILHGHFYQPPREDPVTDIVPMQPSASPHHDWNWKILKECYAANAFSRYLHFDGKIDDIVNNYEYLSFNFGPTLLRWIKRHAPNIYARILDADKKSIDRNLGHGNAIAQGYNHTIIPLDSHQNAIAQVRWGIEDFIFHFKREPEGFWLPETAVSAETVDILIQFGIKYIILSPYQASAIRADGSDTWEELGTAPAPSWRSYRIERPSGTIAVFFYNHLIAQGISFEHYLRSADSLYNRLLMMHNGGDPAHLVHTATDGEVYGHHEPFGDMCLAALIKHIKPDDRFDITNYGAYLEKYPPKYEVLLKKGEQNMGTSWSCHHGVSRWYKDCGCATGGEADWNQQWRSPFRKSLIRLRDSIDEIFRKEVETISNISPDTLFLESGKIFIRDYDRKQFAREVLGRKGLDTGKDSPAVEEKLFRLLEAKKYSLFMFTSCGWFFSEISGLEPVQNIKFALRAINLLSPFGSETLMKTFREDLENVKSNIKEIGTVGVLIDALIHILPDGVEAAAYFLVQQFIGNKTVVNSCYGIYQLESLRTGDIASGYKAFIVIRDTTILKIWSYEARIISDANEGLRIYFNDTNKPDQTEFLVDFSILPEELRRKIADILTSSMNETCGDMALSVLEKIKQAVSFHNKLRIELPRTIRRYAEIAVNFYLHKALSDETTITNNTSRKNLENIFDFAVRNSLDFDRENIRILLTAILSHRFGSASDQLDSKTIEGTISLCELFRKSGIEPDLTIPQNIVFQQISALREISTIRGKREFSGIHPETAALKISTEDRENGAAFARLCSTLGINADDLEKALKENR